MASSIIEALTASQDVHPVFHVDDSELQALARRLHPLLRGAKGHEERDPLDYLLGALHALLRARQLGFVDRAGQLDDVYWEGPLARVRYMQAGNIRTDGKWLAGFYFNDALARLAASLDRIVTLAEVQFQGRKTAGKLWKRLEGLGWGRWRDPHFLLGSGDFSRAYLAYAEVNFLKHDPAGRATGREVTFSEAIAAFGEILDLTQRHTSLKRCVKP